MSEKYDVFRPNREVSDSFKLRPDGYADFVEYHFKHLRKLFKNPRCQAGWNKNVLFGFS